jgi:diadenosine tetraphosphatase ApaH/serine/threonine PP2A family protein phosphatase
LKIAVLTDLHANREAVEAVLEHAERQAVGGFALLGDFVGYGADPGWVVDTARALVREGALAVMGNHDQAVVRGPTASMRPEAAFVVTWTRQRLDPRQLDFLSSLPLLVERGPCLYVHANAWAPSGWDYVSGRAEAARSMGATRQQLTFVGHVHEPHLYHLSATGKAGEFVPVPGVPVPLGASRQWLVVPGSAGQPRDGNPAACYAVHDDADGSVTWWRVPYDVESAQIKIRAARLPQRLAERLADGH